MSSYKATLLRRGLQAFKDGFGGQTATQATASLQLQGPDVTQGLFGDLGAPSVVPPPELSQLRHSTQDPAGYPSSSLNLNLKNGPQVHLLRNAGQGASSYLRVPPVRDYFQQLRVGPLAVDLNSPVWAGQKGVQLPLSAAALQQQQQSSLAQQQQATTIVGADASTSGSAAGMGADSAGMKRKGSANSVHINKQIMACRSVPELLALVKARGAQFDGFNTSSALARVPKLLASGESGAGDSVHLDHVGRTLMECLGEMMCRNIDGFDARGLANAAWAIGKTKYTPHAALPALISVAARAKLDDFNAQNLSNLMWAQVYMHHEDPQLFAVVADKVKRRVHEFKPQELANMIWSFASLGHKDDELADIVARQAVLLSRSFKEQELSNVLWAYGKLGIYDTQLFHALLSEARMKLDHFLPQGISNVAWACAAVGHRDPEFLDRVVRASAPRLHSFDVQALSNLAWALATLGHADHGFMSAVVREGMLRLDRMSPQNMSNMLWSCATLGCRDARMLEAWAAQTLEKLPGFEAQGLSNTAWSFAKLGHRDPLLFDALAGAAIDKADAFTSQGLSNTAYAFAVAQHCHPALLSAVGDAMLRRMDAPGGGATAQNLSVMVWAMATLRHHHEPLYDAVARRLADDAGACEPQNLVNALWAFARVGHQPAAEAGAALARQALRLLPAMSGAEAASALRSLAALDLLDEHAFAAFGEALNRDGSLPAESLNQAFQAQLVFHSNLQRKAGLAAASSPALSEAGNDADNAKDSAAAAAAAEDAKDAVTAKPASSSMRLPSLPEPLLAAAEELWRGTARDVRVSRLQQDVSTALNLAGIPNVLERLTPDGLFSVGISFEVDGRKVAVEVDGRHHYTSSAPTRPLCDVSMRRRLLEDRGWEVVGLSPMDWEAMGASTLQRGESLVARVSAELGVPDWRSPAARASVNAALLAQQQAQAQAQQAQQAQAQQAQAQQVQWNAALRQQRRQAAVAAQQAQQQQQAAAVAMSNANAWLQPATLAALASLMQTNPAAAQVLAAELASTAAAASAAAALLPEDLLLDASPVNSSGSNAMADGYGALLDGALFAGAESNGFVGGLDMATPAGRRSAAASTRASGSGAGGMDAASAAALGFTGSLQAADAMRAVSVLQSSPEGAAMLMQNMYSQLGGVMGPFVPVHHGHHHGHHHHGHHGALHQAQAQALQAQLLATAQQEQQEQQLLAAASAAGLTAADLADPAVAAALAAMLSGGHDGGAMSALSCGGEEDQMADYDLEQLERCVQLAIN